MENQFTCKCHQCGEWFRKKDCLLVDEDDINQITQKLQHYRLWFCKVCQESWNEVDAEWIDTFGNTCQ